MKIIKLLTIISIIMLPALVYAVDNDAGTSSFQFLKIGVGARQAALGDAFSAVDNDVNAIFWNPAGIGRTIKPQLSFSRNQWLGEIDEQCVAGCYPTRYGTFGVGAMYLSMNDLIGYDIDSLGNPVKISDFTSRDMAGIISYGIKAGNLSLGVNAKMVQEEIETMVAKGSLMDAGIQFRIKHHTTLGLSVQNIGPSIKFIERSESVPLNIKAGIASRFINENFLIVADVNKSSDGELQPCVGVEYTIHNIVAFRAGYNNKNSLSSGITMGAGFSFSGWIIDYAFIPYGNLGNVNRISISLKL
ncbi:MAG: PorV/PorQ family protein [Elusimicrobia bacterium]|nr:PorV/PorQ family protein [Candidatus Liberimonas magnetica]